MTQLHDLFASLSREPDVNAPNLQASDATDELLLRECAEVLASQGTISAEQIVTLGDRYGALTLGAAVKLDASGVRAVSDSLIAERALARNATALGLTDRYTSMHASADAFSGAHIVLMQLPKSLAELDELARMIARNAHPDVVLIAGGRLKHMTRSMNEVLSRHFAEVRAGLAWRKSRLLVARGPLKGTQHSEHDASVRWGDDPDLSFRLAAHPATFGGPTLDHGSRLMLVALSSRQELNPQANAPKRVVDVGCGNGVLATWSALMWPGAEIIAADESWSAVQSTKLTAEAARVADRVRVQHADGCEQVDSGWADLVLLNPPFHRGSTVHTGVAHRLIEGTARALTTGGELWVVFNSHLGYRPVIEREIGTTQQVARNSSFTVLCATKR